MSHHYFQPLKPLSKIITFVSLWFLFVIPIAAQPIDEERESLPLDAVVKRSLKSGDKHSYRITLNAGEYFHVEVVQRKIDIVAFLIDPEGVLIARRDRPTGIYGNESLSVVAKKTGEYKLDIEALKWILIEGEYEVQAKVKRVSTLQDSERIRAEILTEEGNSLNQPNEAESLKKACDKYEAALVFWQAVADPYAEAVVQEIAGKCKADLYKPNEAIKAYEKALSGYKQLSEQKQLNDPLAISRTHWFLGIAHNNAGNPLSAIDHFTQSLPFLVQSGDVNKEAETLSTIGALYFSVNKALESIDYYNQALARYRTIPGKNKEEAIVVHNLGNAYSWLNETLKARECFKQALTINRSINDLEGVVTTLISLACTYLSSNEKQKAFPLFEDALNLRREARNEVKTAETLYNIGFFLAFYNAHREALRYLKESSEMWKALRRESEESSTWSLIGVSYMSLGEPEKGLEYFKLALPFFQKTNDERSQIVCLNNLSKAYLALHKFSEALDFGDQSLKLSEKVNDIRGQIRAHYSVGATLVTTMETKGGITHYRRALDLYDQLEKNAEDKLEEAEILVSVGIVESNLGHDQEAMNHYGKALVIFQETKNRKDESEAFSNMAKIYQQQRNFPKALELFNQALSINQQYGFADQESSNLLNIGLINADLGEKSKGLQFFNKALLSSYLSDYKLVQLATLNDLMVELKDLHDPDLAIFYGKQSINIIQELRQNLQQINGGPQRAFLKNIDSMYASLAVVLIEQGRFEEAHQVLNAYKDQKYFDLDLKKIKKPLPLTMTPREEHWSLQYSTALARIRDLYKEREKLELEIGSRSLTAAETANSQKIEEGLVRAKDEFLALFDKARAAFKAPFDPLQDATSGIDDTRKMQEALGKDANKTVVIYTILGGYDYRALIIAPHNLISVTSPINRAELNDKALQLWALLQSDEYDPKILSKEIYDLLFKPIKDELIKRNKLNEVLPEGATILWSLEDSLRYLPMSALYDGEKYLVERYSNVVFTRAEVEKWLTNNSGNWTGLGFGSSLAASVKKPPYYFEPIPNSIRELKTVFNADRSQRGIFRGEIFPGRQFTRTKMVAALQRPDPHPLVHITSHFYFSPGDQTNSYLLLGDEDIFTLDEMKGYPDLFKGVDLLTLSACETAAQRPNSDGREVDGFAELAQRQGAAAVMATLWNVKADSSYSLMSGFYEKKSRHEGITKAEALRQAQLDLMTRTTKASSGLLPRSRTAFKGRGNSTTIKIFRQGQQHPTAVEEGIVWVEEKYARPYRRSDSKRYAHPYYWSPFVLFGNWR
jgi:CHAT domain-containing protein/Tfp pilus assembly protein PilF